MITGSNGQEKYETSDASLELPEIVMKSYVNTKKPEDDYCACHDHIIKYE